MWYVLLRFPTWEEGEGLQLDGDFQVYRWAVHTWLAGGDIIENWAPLWDGGKLPWVYPPFALLPLSVFALPPLTVGVLLMWAVDLAVIGTMLYLIVRHRWPGVGSRGALAVAAVVLPITLWWEPVYSCFAQGQVNIALMGLIAVDCLVRNPRWPRGLLVGIAAAIKLMPAAFLLYFLFRRDFRAAVTGAVTAAVCTLLGFVIAFKASVDYWFRYGPASSVAGHSGDTNQSVLGVVARWDLQPVVQYGTWVAVCLLLAVVLARTVGRVDPPVAMTLTGLFALLASPTSWSSHWVWVAPGLLILLGSAVRARSISRLALVVVIAIAARKMPFRVLAADDVPALLWVPQQLVGNAYVVLGTALLLLTGWQATRKRGAGLQLEPEADVARSYG
ncbi:alpha-1,2-mannosyltransferase [Saccharopolyspora lacisalsi]|uniref:Alpha-1,2-mannosyltransferase n=1 Tax=Halosaccharopolyspora lacisalsi TaxID=1000566 RepID=A0A839DTD0_9PSEU|nr:glycosyltransferase family 87 protein [Halosaccharopolyspora lacisalsi]MBA8823536.1 alpha-1,2-mannosyltransferase [Halosaccharopolyspora lacisalsi]